MINQIIATFAIGLYWMSFLVIGGAFDRRFSFADNLGISVDYWQKITLNFVFGWALMSVLAVMFMVVKIPVIVLSVIWVALLALSAFYLFFQFRGRYTVKSWLLEDWPVKLIIIGSLGACMILGAKWQGPSAGSSDAWVHIGRIVNNLRNGMNIYDPYFSSLADPRYHFNTYHPIMAVGTQLTGLSPVEFWKNMQGISMFVAASSMYFITAAIFEKDRLLKFYIFLTVLGLILFFHGSKNYFHVIYPRSFGVAWLSIFAVCLASTIKRYAPIRNSVVQTTSTPQTKKFLILLCILAFAISTSHHIVAAIALALAGMSIFLYWAFMPTLGRLVSLLKMTLTLSPAFIILLLAPLITIMLPAHLTEETFNYGIHKTPFTEIWGREVVSLRSSVGTLPIILSYAIGIFYLLRRNIALAAVLLAGVLVYPFLVSNPITFPFLREHLPVWALARFKMSNVIPYDGLAFIGLIILIKMVFDFAVTRIPGLQNKMNETPMLRTLANIGLICLLVIPTYPQMTPGVNKKAAATSDYFTRSDWGYAVNKQVLKFPINDRDPNRIIVTDEKTAYTLPANFNVDVLKIISTHATQSANFDDRNACFNTLVSANELDRLEAQALIKPSYYIFASSRKKFQEFPELEQVDSHKIFKRKYAIYRVRGVHMERLVSERSLLETTPCGRIVAGKS